MHTCAIDSTPLKRRGGFIPLPVRGPEDKRRGGFLIVRIFVQNPRSILEKIGEKGEKKSQKMTRKDEKTHKKLTK